MSNILADRYLKKVTKIIYDSKKRASIKQELSDMIDDFTEAYMEMGMSEEEARAEAIKQMGDPEETGELFNKIYRVKFDWKMMIYMFIWSLIIRISTLDVFYDFWNVQNAPKIIFVAIGACFIVLGLATSIMEKWMDFPFFYAYGNNWKGCFFSNSGMICGVGIGFLPLETPNWFLVYSIMAISFMIQRSYMVEKRNQKEQEYLWEIATAQEDFDYRGKAIIKDKKVKVQIKKGVKARKGEQLMVIGLAGFTLLVDRI